MEKNKKVECCNCENIHLWDDRTQIYEKEYCWTRHLCPVCGEESYYEVKETLNKNDNE